MTDDEVLHIKDHLAIRRVLLRHAALTDECDVDAMTELWDPDCRVDFGPGNGGVLVGRDTLLASLRNSYTAFRWSHHQLGGSIIDIDGDLASSMTPAVCWQESLDGERCWVTLRYHHELRRDGSRWVITSRRTVATGAEGSLAERGWSWLERVPGASTPPGTE